MPRGPALLGELRGRRVSAFWVGRCQRRRPVSSRLATSAVAFFCVRTTRTPGRRPQRSLTARSRGSSSRSRFRGPTGRTLAVTLGSDPPPTSTSSRTLKRASGVRRFTLPRFPGTRRRSYSRLASFLPKRTRTRRRGDRCSPAGRVGRRCCCDFECAGRGARSPGRLASAANNGPTPPGGLVTTPRNPAPPVCDQFRGDDKTYEVDPHDPAGPRTPGPVGASTRGGERPNGRNFCPRRQCDGSGQVAHRSRPAAVA